MSEETTSVLALLSAAPIYILWMIFISGSFRDQGYKHGFWKGEIRGRITASRRYDKSLDELRERIDNKEASVARMLVHYQAEVERVRPGRPHHLQYTTDDLAVHAAIVSAVHDGAVDLHVLVPPLGGMMSNSVLVRYAVPFTEAAPGTPAAKLCWAWPPRMP